MIALDTNVLVRLLLRDDARQSEAARQLFDANADSDGALFISDVVLAELAWVLRSRYTFKAPIIADTLRALLGNATLRWQSPTAVAAALQMFEKQSQVDLADCLIVALAQMYNCEAVATFDRAMKELPAVYLM